MRPRVPLARTDAPTPLRCVTAPDSRRPQVSEPLLAFAGIKLKNSSADPSSRGRDSNGMIPPRCGRLCGPRSRRSAPNRFAHLRSALVTAAARLPCPRFEPRTASQATLSVGFTMTAIAVRKSRPAALMMISDGHSLPWWLGEKGRHFLPSWERRQSSKERSAGPSVTPAAARIGERPRVRLFGRE